MIVLRTGQPSDQKKLYMIHILAIRETCSPFYPEEVIQAWIRSLKMEWYEHILHSGTVVVAVEEEKVLGFGQWNKADHFIESLYVLPYSLNQGIGSRLLKQLEEQAREENVQKLFVSSSLNAIDFYKKHGYLALETSYYPLEEELFLEGLKMMKEFTRRKEERI